MKGNPLIAGYGKSSSLGSSAYQSIPLCKNDRSREFLPHVPHSILNFDQKSLIIPDHLIKQTPSGEKPRSIVCVLTGDRNDDGRRQQRACN
ncbi:hypothetical protein TNCV_1452381 [Trichonephila clavipes]|nr:hypothetical protein TNCV_1452381 [Trichonephila clavipes]